MKKLAIILLGAGLLLTACQQKELETSPASNGNVTITVLASDAISVRSNSANGGITNMGSNYYLRYLLYIYDADSDELVCSDVATQASYSDPCTFNEELPDMEDCYAVVWADFVTDNTGATDLHYDTSSFPEIDCSNAAINDESYDAFYGYKKFAVTGANVNVTLKRPFAKLRLVTTDWDNANYPDNITLTYSAARYTSFNAKTGVASSTGSTVEFTGTIDPSAYDAGYDATTGYRTLAVDYILVNDEESTVNLAYAATKSDGTEFHSLLISQDIPLQRNYLTTVMGNLLTDTDSFNFNVSIDENFESETIIKAGHFTVSPAQLIYVGEDEYYYVNIGDEVTLTPVVDGSDAAWTWTWTSDDGTIATVTGGVVTGVAEGVVTITATHTDTDGTIYTCTGELYVHEPITGGLRFSDETDTATETLSIDASYTVDVDTYGTEQTLSYEVDDESVLTVDDEGAVTFLAPGEATITISSNADEAETGYYLTASLTLTVPAGYYNEVYNTSDSIDGLWALNQTQTSTLTFSTDHYTIGTTAGTASLGHLTTGSSGTYGSNIKHDVYLDPNTYPIVAFHLTDLSDDTANIKQSHIMLDVSGYPVSDPSNSNKRFTTAGGSTQANDWTTKYSLSDNTCVIVYDLNSYKWTGNSDTDYQTLSEITHFNTWALKYTDIKDNEDNAATASWDFYWFKTFANTTDLENALTDEGYSSWTK